MLTPATSLVGVAVLLLVGCAPVLRGRPFNNSSADFNRSDFHRTKTPGEIETVADAVVAIMEGNSAKLVKRRESERGSLVLSFRVSVERVKGSTSQSSGSYSAPTRWFRAGAFSSETVTRTDYVAYGAVFYIELFPVHGGVTLQAIGLPVIDGVTACPDVAAPYRDCHPALPPGELAFADHVYDRSGIEVRGSKEAEVLSGLLAQLQRKRWQNVFRGSFPLVDPKNTEGIDQAFTTPAER